MPLQLQVVITGAKVASASASINSEGITQVRLPFAVRLTSRSAEPLARLSLRDLLPE